MRPAIVQRKDFCRANAMISKGVDPVVPVLILLDQSVTWLTKNIPSGPPASDGTARAPPKPLKDKIDFEIGHVLSHRYV